MTMNANQIISAVDSCLEDLQKQAAAKSNVPADPDKKGTVKPEYNADGSPKATTGIDGPAGTGKNAEGELSDVKTGDANTPPATKKETDDSDPNPLSKQASSLLASVSDICGRINKKASEKPEDKADDKLDKTASNKAPASGGDDANKDKPEVKDTPGGDNLDKTAEHLSQDIPSDPDSIMKVASMVLSTERGRGMLQELAREQLGQEQAESMLAQVDEEYSNLQKHAAEQQSEHAQMEEFVRGILESDEISKSAKEHFIAGLHIHNKAMEDCVNKFEEALGGEELIKSASEEDRNKALASAESITEAYIHGSQLAKQASAMMAEQEIGPEELEALMVELDQYSPEEKIAAVELLVQQGEIPPEVAEELIMAFAAEMEGGAAAGGGMGGAEAMPEEYAAGMGKAASVLEELEKADAGDEADKK